MVELCHLFLAYCVLYWCWNPWLRTSSWVVICHAEAVSLLANTARLKMSFLSDHIVAFVLFRLWCQSCHINSQFIHKIFTDRGIALSWMETIIFKHIGYHKDLNCNAIPCPLMTNLMVNVVVVQKKNILTAYINDTNELKTRCYDGSTRAGWYIKYYISINITV